MSQKKSLVLITEGTPNSSSSTVNTQKLINCLSQVAEIEYVITYNIMDPLGYTGNPKLIQLKYRKNRIARFLASQFAISSALIQIRKENKVDLVLFAFGEDLNFIPILLSKIFFRSVVLRTDGRPSTILSKYHNNKSIVQISLFKVIEYISYHLASVVVTECDYMINDNGLHSYNHGVGPLYVDIDIFAIKNREYDVGYIGRFDKEKGIIEFLEAISDLDINALIVGDGPEKNIVNKMIDSIHENGKARINMIGWVPNNSLPKILNSIKILVIPSKKEGLPNIVLEAMACHTLILANGVGGIPGVVHHGSTGFLLKSNSPSDIKSGINETLKSNLELIAENALLSVNEYSYQNAIKSWKPIIGGVYH